MGMFGTDMTYEEYATANRKRERALLEDAKLDGLSPDGMQALLNAASGAADNAIRAEMAIRKGRRA